MDKKLNRPIMVRQKLRNKFLRLKTEENRVGYVRKCNYCVNMLRRVKREYYHKLIINSITDNHLFWKTLCRVFCDQTLSKNLKTTLIEKGEIVTDDTKITEIFKKFKF